MQKQHDKRPDIQGLRAWAVICVVIFHFFPAIIPFGYLGVDVFFVLSGFLITLVLEGRPACSATYQNFYFKRLRRILPLALLIVLLCVFIIAALQTGYDFAGGIKSAFYSMFFIKNYQPNPSLEEGYFEALEKGSDLFTHFWSLCVEIQFYILAPFVLHLLKPSSDNAFASYAYMTVLSAISYAYSLLSNPTEAFDDTPARLWQFLAGAMAMHSDAILSRWTPLPETAPTDDEKDILLDSVDDDDVATPPDPSTRKRALIIPCIFVVAATAVVLYTENWEIVLRFYTTLLAALVLVFRSKSVFLCHTVMQILGDISYSLYLIHWPIVCVLELLAIEIWQAKVAAMLVAVALSYICHFAYEKKYLTLSVKSTIFLVLGLYLLILASIGASSFMHREPMDEANGMLQDGKLKELTQEEIDKENRRLSHTNDIRFIGCKQISGGNPIGYCELPNGNGTLSFMIMGNSYAANLGSLIQKHFRPHYGPIKERTIAQCEPLVNTIKGPYCPNYLSAHAKFDADIEREKPDILFLVERFITPNVPITRPIEKDELYLFMKNRLEFFEKNANKKVFILNAFPTPARGDDLIKRMKAHNRPIKPYMPEGIENDAKPMKERVLKLAEVCAKCVIFDIEPVFLNEAGNFTVLNPQKLQYFDNPRHLNILGRQLVEPVFEKLSDHFDTLLETKYPDNVFDASAE